MALKKRALFNLFTGSTVFALLIRLFFLEDYRIISNSMVPNLLTGDLVFVSKIAFNVRLPFSSYEVLKFKRPVRGEVVAFSLPDRGQETFVKRVVGLEGDRIELKAGTLFVNGIAAVYRVDPASKGSYEIFPETKSYSIEPEKGAKLGSYGPVDVPPKHFFVLGDNRSDSIDSRSWGPVPYSCLKGRVELVWMSIDEVGKFRGNRLGSWIN